MKSLKILLVTLFLSCVAATASHAQAVVEKDQNWHFENYVSYDSHQVVTPNGTINLRVNWKLELDHPYIAYAILNGTWSVEVNANGNFGTIVGTLTFYRTGRVMFSGHSNSQ